MSSTESGGDRKTKTTLEPEVLLDESDKQQELPEEVKIIDQDTGESNLILWDAFKALPTPVVEVYSDPLSYYMAQLRHIEPLPPEQQQKLAKQYHEQGDVEAAQMLILTNLRLVVKIAREYQRRWSDLLDLIQEGNVGLSEAITRYNPYRGVKFTSYAQYWIRAMILNYLLKHFQPIRIGSTRAGRRLFFNLQKTREKLKREGHLNPSPKLIADELGVNEDDVVAVAKHLDSRPVSIDAKVPGYDTLTYSEMLSVPEGADPETTAANSEFLTQVNESLAEFGNKLISDRDKKIWKERLLSEEPRTLEDLGKEFRVSKERVRQLEVVLKKRLKQFIEQKFGPDIKFNL